MNLLVGKPFMR